MFVCSKFDTSIFSYHTCHGLGGRKKEKTIINFGRTKLPQKPPAAGVNLSEQINASVGARSGPGGQQVEADIVHISNHFQ